ncbi:hypothetical protein D3C80_751510 [compost metagenome]
MFAGRFEGEVACTGLFAGKPAPTGTAQFSHLVTTLWERVYPRRGQHRRSIHLYTAAFVHFRQISRSVHVRQYLRQAVHCHHRWRKPWPGVGRHCRWMPTGPGNFPGRPAARPRPAQARHQPAHHPAPGSRRGGNPLRRVRRPHHRLLDRPADPQHRPEVQGLLGDQGPVPPGPRRLHLPPQVRHPRLPRRWPQLGPRNRHARGRRCHRQEIPGHPGHHRARLHEPVGPDRNPVQDLGVGGAECFLQP